MSGRKQHVEELLENFQTLKRSLVFRSDTASHLPHITPAQWSALLLIEERKESSVKDLADILSITSSAATQLVDTLVKNGYVSRTANATDRRAVTLTLSKGTSNQIKKMKAHIIDASLKLFEALNDKEFAHYVALNDKIVRGFSQKNI